MTERRANPHGHMPTTPTTLFDWVVVVSIIVTVEVAGWQLLILAGVLS